MPVQKKYTLNTEKEAPYELLGLLTDSPDYQLCWQLNQLLPIQLKKTDDFVWRHKTLPQEQYFPCFKDQTDAEFRTILIRNLSKEHLQVTPYQQFDYLLLIPTRTIGPAILRLTNSLKESNLIRGVYPLDLSGLVAWIG